MRHGFSEAWWPDVPVLVAFGRRCLFVPSLSCGEVIVKVVDKFSMYMIKHVVNRYMVGRSIFKNHCAGLGGSWSPVPVLSFLVPAALCVAPHSGQ